MFAPLATNGGISCGGPTGREALDAPTAHLVLNISRKKNDVPFSISILKYSYMKPLLLSLLITTASLTSLSFSWAQNSQQQEVQTISGYVKIKDWVADKLIVNTGSDEMTFVVPNGTRVTKGIHNSSLSEININDYVTIEYYDAQHAGLKAVTITIRSTES